MPTVHNLSACELGMVVMLSDIRLLKAHLLNPTLITSQFAAWRDNCYVSVTVHWTWQW